MLDGVTPQPADVSVRLQELDVAEEIKMKLKTRITEAADNLDTMDDDKVFASTLIPCALSRCLDFVCLWQAGYAITSCFWLSAGNGRPKSFSQ